MWPPLPLIVARVAGPVHSFRASGTAIPQFQVRIVQHYVMYGVEAGEQITVRDLSNSQSETFGHSFTSSKLDHYPEGRFGTI